MSLGILYQRRERQRQRKRNERERGSNNYVEHQPSKVNEPNGTILEAARRSHERMVMEASPPESRYSPKEEAKSTMDWKRFSNEITEEQAKKVARILGLKIGGNKYPFGGNYRTKGLYAYTTGQYKGEAYFGRGEGSRTSKKLRAVSPTAHIVGISKEKDP